MELKSHQALRHLVAVISNISFEAGAASAERKMPLAPVFRIIAGLIDQAWHALSLRSIANAAY
jgi:hypothetical protein